MSRRAGEDPNPLWWRGSQSFMTMGNQAHYRSSKQRDNNRHHWQMQRKALGNTCQQVLMLHINPFGVTWTRDWKTGQMEEQEMLFFNWKLWLHQDEPSMHPRSWLNDSITVVPAIQKYTCKIFVFPSRFQGPKELCALTYHGTFLVWRLSEIIRVLYLNWWRRVFECSFGCSLCMNVRLSALISPFSHVHSHGGFPDTENDWQKFLLNLYLKYTWQCWLWKF